MKQFILDRHTVPGTPSLEQVPTEKIPVYETKTAAENDIANLEVGQIIATKDEGNELSNPVDVVEDGNMHAVTSNAVADGLDEVMPTGTILPGMWQTAPKGFLLCNGAIYQTSQYPKLASVLGAAGDTFNVPNLVGRFLEGANSNVGAYKTAGLPNITGTFTIQASGGTGFWGNSTDAFNNIIASSQKYINDGISNPTGTPIIGFEFDASKSNPVYGNSSTVQPASFTVNYIIKY